MLIAKNKLKNIDQRTLVRVQSSDPKQIQNFSKSNTQIVKSTPQDDIFALTHPDQREEADRVNLEGSTSENLVSYKSRPDQLNHREEIERVASLNKELNKTTNIQVSNQSERGSVSHYAQK